MSIGHFRGPGGATLGYRLDDFTDPWTEPVTVVLAHGFGGFSKKWYRWVPLLSPHARVVRTDLRGWGLSKVSAETYRNSLDAIALLDHLGARKAVWIGEHTGALVGVMLSIRVPERLHAIAIMGAPLRPKDIPAFKAAETSPDRAALGFRESTDYMRTHGMRPWIEAVDRGIGLLSKYPAGYRDWYLDEIAGEDPFLVAKFRRGMIDTDMMPLLKDIGVPVLWVEGDDPPYLIPAWRAALEQHSKVRLVDVNGPGLDIAYLRPEACIAAVRAFLTDLGVWPEGD